MSLLKKRSHRNISVGTDIALNHHYSVELLGYQRVQPDRLP
ncbi:MULTISPECIES: hypothetical protein [unclassified Moorena]|nr:MULTISPECIES: hypothetical protein [unclassified Moorena]